MKGLVARFGQALILLILILMVAIGHNRYGERKFTKPVPDEKTVVGFTKSVPDVKTVFGFDHTNLTDCDNMYINNKYRPARLLKINQSMEMLNKEAHKYAPKILGNSGMKPTQSLFFQTIANNSFINTICEVGFNAGHSTYMLLTGNTKAHVYSFTLGAEKYNKAMYEFINNLFPGRLTVTWGDSRKTIPAFTKKNPGIKCDLIVIDGSHRYKFFMADFKNLRPLANMDYHVLIADDYVLYGVIQGWEEEKAKGHLKEHFHCQIDRKLFYSMVVGAYT